jgi:hypothetical protein
MPMELGTSRRTSVAVGFGLSAHVVVVPAANGGPSWSSRKNDGDRHDPCDRSDEEKILHVITSGGIVMGQGKHGRWPSSPPRSNQAGQV